MSSATTTIVGPVTSASSDVGGFNFEVRPLNIHKQTTAKDKRKRSSLPTHSYSCTHTGKQKAKQSAKKRGNLNKQKEK